MIAAAVYVNDEDVEILKKLSKNVDKVEFRMVPSDSAKTLESVIKEGKQSAEGPSTPRDTRAASPWRRPRPTATGPLSLRLCGGWTPPSARCCAAAASSSPERTPSGAWRWRGAVKVWELPQMISIGYELEEGIHGPNYGYNSNHCVVILNDGGREDKKALALGRWMKEVHHNGLLVGSSVAAADDLKLDVRCGDFSVLEFAPVVQIIAYRLANDMGRDLFAPHDNSVMERYFKTHREDEK